MTEHKPMTIVEAIEACKIVAPYANTSLHEFKQSPVKAHSSFFKRINSDSPINALRLISLMLHDDLEQVAAQLEDQTYSQRRDLLLDLLSINPLIDLCKMAMLLGFSAKEV